MHHTDTEPDIKIYIDHMWEFLGCLKVFFALSEMEMICVNNFGHAWHPLHIWCYTGQVCSRCKRPCFHPCYRPCLTFLLSLLSSRLSSLLLSLFNVPVIVPVIVPDKRDPVIVPVVVPFVPDNRPDDPTHQLLLEQQLGIDQAETKILLQWRCIETDEIFCYKFP